MSLKLAGDTQEGAELVALMRKSNELSALANKPLKGGLSQFTDIFNPLDTDGRFDFTRAISAPVSGLGAISTSGASLIPAGSWSRCRCSHRSQKQSCSVCKPE